MKSGIYAIRNKANGKMYIGQSQDIQKRWRSHKYHLSRGSAQNRHLQYAWNHYGEASFEFLVIETCSVDVLDEREIYWIAHFDSVKNGYNVSSGGHRGCKWKMTSEQVEKIKVALTGVKKSESSKRNMSLAKKKYYEKHTPATSIPVVCLNTREVFINASEAHKRYPSADISALHSCCKGRGFSCGKLDNGENIVWAYKKDFDVMSEQEIHDKLSYTGRTVAIKAFQKPVVCITTGVQFDSCVSAAEHYNISVSNLNGCLKGRQKSAGRDPDTGEKLYWEYCS